MNKTTKLLVGIVLILGGIYAIQRFTSRNSTTVTVNPFAGIDTSAVDKVTVNFGHEIEVVRAGGVWNVTSPVNFPADPGQLNLLLTRIASDPSASVVADNLADSAAYGLGSNAASFELFTKKGARVSLKVGNVTPDYNGCYVEIAGRDEVLQLSTNLRTLIGQPLSDWRDKRIFHFGLSEIEAADFALGDTLYHFFHIDTTWQVNGKIIPQMKARDIVGELIGCEAIGFVDSSIAPGKLLIDYGITLKTKAHITGQIFKSAESEVAFGQLCLSNSANNQTYTVSSSLPEVILQGLRELQTGYLTKESS